MTNKNVDKDFVQGGGNDDDDGVVVPLRAPPQVEDRGMLTRCGRYQGNKIPRVDQN
jgi:hypothetical protein